MLEFSLFSMLLTSVHTVCFATDFAIDVLCNKLYAILVLHQCVAPMCCTNVHGGILSICVREIMGIITHHEHIIIEINMFVP